MAIILEAIFSMLGLVLMLLPDSPSTKTLRGWRANVISGLMLASIPILCIFRVGFNILYNIVISRTFSFASPLGYSSAMDIMLVILWGAVVCMVQTQLHQQQSVEEADIKAGRKIVETPVDTQPQDPSNPFSASLN